MLLDEDCMPVEERVPVDVERMLLSDEREGEVL